MKKGREEKNNFFLAEITLGIKKKIFSYLCCMYAFDMKEAVSVFEMKGASDGTKIHKFASE